MGCKPCQATRIQKMIYLLKAKENGKALQSSELKLKPGEKYDKDGLVWRRIRGNDVPFRKGQSFADGLREFVDRAEKNQKQPEKPLTQKAKMKRDQKTVGNISEEAKIDYNEVISAELRQIGRAHV